MHLNWHSHLAACNFFGTHFAATILKIHLGMDLPKHSHYHTSMISKI